MVGISILFYDSIFPAILFSPFLIVYAKQQEVQFIKKEKGQLTIQFKDMLNSITASLSAGYSMENSISEAKRELSCMYEASDRIMKQMAIMESQVRMNVTVEQIFYEFAQKSELEDIQTFAYIVMTAKRTGGNLLFVIKQISSMIVEKIMVEREIQTMMAEKTFETTIMRFIPIAMIVYLRLCAPTFIEPMYQNVRGAVIMTILLGIYALTQEIIRRIINIKV